MDQRLLHVPTTGRINLQRVPVDRTEQIGLHALVMQYLQQQSRIIRNQKQFITVRTTANEFDASITADIVADIGGNVIGNGILAVTRQEFEDDRSIHPPGS